MKARDLRSMSSEERNALWYAMKYDTSLFAKIMMDHIVDKIPAFHKDLYSMMDEMTARQYKWGCGVVFRGGAKAQSLDSKVLTPNGWTTIGDLSVGDLVIGSDGNAQKVIELHPIQNMDLYRLSLRSGETTLCNLDHKWEVMRISGGAGFYKDKKIILSTRELINFPYKKLRNDKRYNKDYSECYYAIKRVAPINFNEKDLPIDPYTLGVWLGDGHSASARITTADPEIFDYIPYRSAKKTGKYLYQIYNDLHKILRINNLLNNKHIPEEYFTSSIQQREALLQGLIDTDGTVSKRGNQISFSATPSLFIDQVATLVRSLGGSASKSIQKTRASKDSEYKVSYKLFIRLPEQIFPAKLKRKAERFKGNTKTYSAITDISFSHRGLGRCISVENEDGLYVTNDYMLTHNSTISKGIKGVHDIVYAHEPVSCWISESKDQAGDDLEGVKDEILYNEGLQELYGVGEGSTWSQYDTEFSNGTFITCKGYTSRIRGIKHKNQRPTKFLLDDFESEHNISSKNQREKVAHWINRTVTRAGEPNTIFQFFGTIVHTDAWLAKAKEYSFFNGNEGRYIQYPVEKDGIATWAARYSMSDINKAVEVAKAQGDLAGLLQEWWHIPASSSEVLFNGDNVKGLAAVWQRYEHISFLVKDGRKIPINVFTGVDPASRTKKNNDDTIIMTIGIMPNKTVVILDIVAEKLSPANQIPAVMKVTDRFRPKIVTIETQSYQLALADWLREKMVDKRCLPFPIKEFTSSKSKNDKYLVGLEPLINNNNVFYLEGCPNIDLLKKQLDAFNVERDHDDTIDGLFLSYLNSYAPPKYDVDKYIHEIKLRSKDKSDGHRKKKSWMAL